MTLKSPQNLTKMNSILNEQLEVLGEYDSITSIRSPSYNRRETSSYTTKTTEPRFTFDPIPYNSSVRRFKGTENPIRIADSHSTFQSVPQQQPYGNEKIQKDLLQLYAKVMNIEKQVYSNEHSSPKLTSNNMLSRSNYESHANLRKYDEDFDSPEDYDQLGSSYKSKRGYNSKSIDGTQLRKAKHSTAHHHHQPIQEDWESDHNRSMKKSAKKRILNNERDSDSSYDQSVMIRKSLGHFRNKSNVKNQEKQESFAQQKARYKKEMKQLKMEYDQDKADLVKERIKGNELSKKMKKLNKSLSRLEVTLENAAKVEVHYGKLLGSFEKSEHIRGQQKRLLLELSEEVNYWKKKKILGLKENFLPRNNKGTLNNKKTIKGQKKSLFE